MTRRTMPFGYKYENGQIIVEKTSAGIVSEIYDRYVAGESMLNISSLLNRLNVQYSPGVVGWNKARIKRILENDHYVGDEVYPQIVTEEIFEQANEIRSNRNNQKGTNRESAIYHLNVLTICPCCDTAMRRINEPRSKIHERWKCKNAECGKLVIISDDNLIADITEILNLLADTPDVIRTPVDNNAINLDSCRLENEIRRLFDSRQLDKDIIRQKLLEEAAVNYRTLSSKQYEAQRLKDIFRSQKRSDEFSIELFNQSVDAISFDDNDSVNIRLITGQTVRKGETNAAS